MVEEHRRNSIGKLLAQPPVADRLLGMAWAFLSSRMLLYADELGLFTELARDPADLFTLCARVGIDEDVAEPFLTTLAGLGLIELRGGLYCNADDVNLYLDHSRPSYIGNLLAVARTAMHDTDGTTEHVSRPQREPKPSSLLSERMWADIDSLLRMTPLE